VNEFDDEILRSENRLGIEKAEEIHAEAKSIQAEFIEIIRGVIKTGMWALGAGAKTTEDVITFAFVYGVMVERHQRGEEQH